MFSKVVLGLACIGAVAEGQHMPEWRQVGTEPASSLTFYNPNVGKSHCYEINLPTTKEGADFKKQEFWRFPGYAPGVCPSAKWDIVEGKTQNFLGYPGVTYTSRASDGLGCVSTATCSQLPGSMSNSRCCKGRCVLPKDQTAECSVFPEEIFHWSTASSKLRGASLSSVSCLTNSSEPALEIIVTNAASPLSLKVQQINNKVQPILCSSSDGDVITAKQFKLTINPTLASYIEITPHHVLPSWDSEIWRNEEGHWPTSFTVNAPSPSLTATGTPLECTFNSSQGTTVNVNNTGSCYLKVRTCNTDVSHAPYPVCHGGPGTPTSYKDCPKFIQPREQVTLTVDSDTTYMAFVCCPNAGACEGSDYEVYKNVNTGLWPKEVQVPAHF